MTADTMKRWAKRIGLSLLGPRGGDAMLLAAAALA